MARIEFCGGIGAGKSTCAALLARHWSLPLVSERFADNPYWRRFYDQPAAFALEKDLSFLLSHAEDMRTGGPGPFVCDFAMFQTVAYSAIVGDAADTGAVAAAYARLAARLGSAQAVVRLRCATDVQLARIRARGRRPEAGITADYLGRLDRAIDAQLTRLPAGTIVLAFDTSHQPPEALLDHPGLAAAHVAVRGAKSG